MSRGLCMAVALAVLAAVIGCASVESRSQAPLYATRDPMMADVPVPSRFAKDMSRSFCNETTGFRTGLLVYRGKADAAQLLEFYQDNMPVSGWALQKKSSNFGSYVLDFEKGRETAEVKITPERFATDVAIAVNPAGRK